MCLSSSWGIGDRAGTLPQPIFVLLDSLSILPAYRVFMVWVYDRTESLLLAILMHVALTACTLTLLPVTAGLALVMFDSRLRHVVAGAVIGARGVSGVELRSAHRRPGAVTDHHVRVLLRVSWDWPPQTSDVWLFKFRGKTPRPGLAPAYHLGPSRSTMIW